MNGVTKTKFHKKIKINLSNRIKMIPAKKIANVEDISNYIYFIIQSNFITNEIIKITGGE